MGKIGIVILAAGASTRLGQPKQLLPYQGKSLIEQITTVAIASHCQPIVVVLGANASQIKSKLSTYNLEIAWNEQWSTGMASSLRCGLKKIRAIAPDLNAIILVLCDQPFVSTPLLQELINGYATGNYPIVASQYGEVIGVPALFDQTLFPELTRIEGDRGARHIIHSNQSKVLRIPFPEGLIDIDTPDDLAHLSRLRHN